MNGVSDFSSSYWNGILTFMPKRPPMTEPGMQANEKSVNVAMILLSVFELRVFSWSIIRPYFSIAISMLDCTPSMVKSIS